MYDEKLEIEVICAEELMRLNEEQFHLVVDAYSTLGAGLESFYYEDELEADPQLGKFVNSKALEQKLLELNLPEFHLPAPMENGIWLALDGLRTIENILSENEIHDKLVDIEDLTWSRNYYAFNDYCRHNFCDFTRAFVDPDSGKETPPYLLACV